MSSSARIDELRRKFDENPRRYFAPLANEYRKAGDFDQAIFICQEYLPQQPGHMSGHIVFGQALFEAKRLPEARTVFETALSLDPENLIALRHLADIARDLGEIEAARGWYERVLQADPRNDEIAAIMTSLGEQSAAATAPAPGDSAQDNAGTAATTSPDAPTAEIPAPPRPAAVAETVELSEDAVQEILRARQARTPAATPSPAPVAPDTLTLDEASTVELTIPVMGLETTAVADAAPAVTVETPGLEGNAATGSGAGSVDLSEPLSLDDISLPSGSPPSPAPSASAPPIETAPSADDGLLDLEGFGFGTPAPAAAAPTAPTASETPIDGGHPDGEGLLDLEMPSSTPAASAPKSPGPETVPTLVMAAVGTAIPMVKEAVEAVAPSVIDAVGSAVPSVMDAVMSVTGALMGAMRGEPLRPPDPSPPPMEHSSTAIQADDREAPADRQAPSFVTETMAQLYLGQGHRAQALEIYEKLMAARPHDAALRAKYEAVLNADPDAKTAEIPAVKPADVAPASSFMGTGPSIRQVLRSLFGIADGPASAGGLRQDVPAETGSVDILFASESVADALHPLALAFDGGFVASRGSVDELFDPGSR